MRQYKNCLGRMVQWAETWGMAFNMSNCKVMHVGKCNPGNEYPMNEVPLNTMKEEKDISMTVCSNLKPAGEQITKSAALDLKSLLLLGQIYTLLT